jgi:hypothetical protein
MGETNLQELDLLLDRLCEGGIEEDMLAMSRLIKLIDESKVCRHRYLDILELHTTLWMLGGDGTSSTDISATATPTTLRVSHQGELFGSGSVPYTFLDNAIHGTFGYLSSDWLVSYLVATIIFVVGSLITSHIYIPQPEQIVDNSPSIAPAVQPERNLVGQVTGLVDCHWNDSRTAAYLGHRVAAGDEFALVSGLVEITYDTGAKVLLQGPVTYQVDSPRGGFLSVGKLTARVEKKEARDQESDFLNSALFAVRTPTAVVTDLGTEFGVEVSDTGETQSHVFLGAVQLQQTGVAEGKETLGNTIILHASEAARVTIQHGVKEKYGKETTTKENTLVLSRGEFNATAFVLPDQMRQYAEKQRLKPLRRWQAYSQKLRKDPALVAYYDFQMKGDNCAVLPNLSAAGRALDGRVEGGDWVEGRMPGKMGLHFRGPKSDDRIVLPSSDRFEFSGEFSLAIWFNAKPNNSGGTSLITKGEHSWRFQYAGGLLYFHTNNANVPMKDNNYYQGTKGHTNIVDNRWHLAVAVYKPQNDKVAQKQLYIDGQLDAENVAPMPRERSKCPVWLGANGELGERELYGQIDEVAIFSRALSPEEAAAMFQAGKP